MASRPLPPKPSPAPAAKPAKKAKKAEARPSLVWLGAEKLNELAGRINAEFGPGRSRSSRPACSSRPTISSRSRSYLRDKNPIKYDYLASLQSVHYEDCIEVNYQLDSTTNRGP